MYTKSYTGSGQTQYEMSLREPWITLIAQGRKTVEGRAGPAGKFKDWIGKRLRLFNNEKHVDVIVLDVHYYPDVYSYLRAEGWQNATPNAKSFEESVSIHHQIYSDDVIRERGGFIGILIRRV